MPVLAGIRVEGVSVGGIETCIRLPEWRLAFDLGAARPEAVSMRTVLFTHPHIDHLGGIASHAATRALRGMPEPTYVLPRSCADEVERLFAVWSALDCSALGHRSVRLGPGEAWDLDRARRVRAFRTLHTVPSQGYAVCSVRSKLRPELAGLPGAEIARRRGLGETVADELEVPEVAFTGDTRIDALEREVLLRTARVLIHECTFLDDRVSVEECRRMGHVHLEEIAERADLFENEAVLLTHFSARYRPDEIEPLLDRRLPARLRERVVPLL